MVVGMHEQGYGAKPKVEEMLAGYLSPSLVSSRRKPTLPTKPCRMASSLVGKAYGAAGQAVAPLHTMAVLQAYQADLLRYLDHGEGLGPEAACLPGNEADGLHYWSFHGCYSCYRVDSVA